jgi:hypothetical protein
MFVAQVNTDEGKEGLTEVEKSQPWEQSNLGRDRTCQEVAI